MRQDSTQAYRSSMPALAAVGSEVEAGGAAAAEHEFCASREQGKSWSTRFRGRIPSTASGPPHLKIPDFGYGCTRTFSLTGKIRNRIIMHTYCIRGAGYGLAAQKRFRQGQILKLITSEAISSQDELRRRLAQMKLRVTQATLSRDIAELKLVKTAAGYKPLGAAADEAALRARASGSRGAGIPARRARRRTICWC